MGFKAKLWLLWFIGAFSGGTAFVAAMVTPGYQWPYLIGETTGGHYQIELACKACHLSPFGGKEALQESCIGCHGEELKLAKDSHPAKKFNDPRNADRLEKLDAQLCLTCHREHKPRLTGDMGVTAPADFCRLCHETIGEERPSHKGLAFSGCAASGCHNYHDNRALYEDFLLKHASQPDMAERPLVALKAAPPSSAMQLASGPAKALPAHAADAPADKRDPRIVAEWSADIHAREGVNCGRCHMAETPPGAPKAWTDRPGAGVCGECHKQEGRSFTEGKHGMRLRADAPAPLPPMRPGLARQPMKASAHGREIGCASCHGAHGFDTVKAQVDACLGCHDDSHSRAYIGSPHHRLWQAELDGKGEKGGGVSCATCHMPRVKAGEAASAPVFVNHNQNDNLRPSEKMVRTVCGDCHGLQFTLDALADEALALSNYRGRPSARTRSIDWAVKRQAAKK